MAEQTTCDCILTSINDPFNPGNFSFDVKQTVIDDETSPYIDLDFNNLIEADFELDPQDKSDSKSVSIQTTGTPGIIRYTFNTEANNGSTYWNTPFRTDTFDLKIKNTFTGETSIVKVTLRNIPVHQDFDPINFTVNVQYPYPDSLRVNLDYAWESNNPNNAPGDYMVYQTGNIDPRYISAAMKSLFRGKELRIELEPMSKAESGGFTIQVPFYVVDKNEGPVNTQNDKIGMANVILFFES